MATDGDACGQCRQSNFALTCCRVGLVRRSRRVRHRADGTDRISALPDDLLLQVLSCLGCVRAAATTSLLSHRWRHLWTQLPRHDFHGISPGQLEMALARVTSPAGSIKITMPKHHRLLPTHISSLLSAIVRLEPAKLDISMWMETIGTADAIELPRFDHTTSIKLCVSKFFTLLLPTGDFTKLKSISLTLCHIDLGALLNLCPSLRRLKIHWSLDSIKVHSSTLQELIVYAKVVLRTVDIAAPLLNWCVFVACKGTYDEFSLSFSAPLLEDLSWRCKCQSRSWFGVKWLMWDLSFRTPMAHWRIQQPQLTSNWKESYLQLADRPCGNTLSLRIRNNCHSTSSNVGRRFEQDISRIPVRSFSNLELRINPEDHVYGAMVLDVLGLCTSIQRLKIMVYRDQDIITREMCSASCFDQPNNWKNRSIMLPNLKELEVERFGGEDHEADLLKVIFRSATMLERVNLYFTSDASPESCSVYKEFPSIFNAYPSVKFNIYSWCRDPILTE